MSDTETYDRWACTDCAHLIATGETPPDMTVDETAAYLDRIAAHVGRIGARVHWGLGRSDGREYCDFSRSRCDTCGSHLSGPRHGVLASLSPHGVTVTNPDGSVTVTSEDDAR